MTNNEKFEEYKQKLIKENETNYGREIRAEYGTDAVKRSKEKILNMTQEEHEAVTTLSQQLKETLAQAFKTGDPASEIAQ